MDYIYSKIDSNLINDYTDITLTRAAYDSLPNPSEEYYMRMAIVEVNNYECTYLCIKNISKYIWKLVCISGGKLNTPVIHLAGNKIYWDAIQSADHYDIWSNDVFIKTITETEYNLDTILSKDGVYRIQVVARGIGFADSTKSNYVDYLILSIIVDGGLIT